MQRLSLAILLIALVTGSCGKKSPHAEEDKQPDLSLLVKDSIQVNYAGILILQDVDPEKEKMLLYDQQREIFLIADFKGAVLYQINKQEDSKGSYSFLLGPARLLGED